MGLTDNLKKVWRSFSFATHGIIHAIRKELNLKIHLTVAVFVLLAGLWLGLSEIEWIFIFLTIGIVISLELVNTAIERTVDLATEEIRPLAKQAKDIAAGAVFMFALISVVIGVIIFLPKLLKLL